MKINTQQKLVSLKGEVLKGDGIEVTLGLAISNILISSQVKGKYKLYILGKKFFDDKEIDIDMADMSLIKSELEATTIYTPLVTGQILDILYNLENKKEK